MIKFPNVRIRLVKIPKFLSASMRSHFNTKVRSYQAAPIGAIFEIVFILFSMNTRVVYRACNYLEVGPELLSLLFHILFEVAG